MSDSIAPSSLQRDRELQALYDGSADGILIATISDLRLVRANRAICRMLGYSEQELLSLSVKDIHPPAELPHVFELFEAMSQRRLKRARDVSCLRKDGGVIYADITVSHIAFGDKPCLLAFFHDITEEKRAVEAIRASDERGMPTAILGITRDATARRQTEGALRESEAKLRSLLENLSDLVLLLDRDSNVLFVNHSRTQYSPETLLGHPGLAFVTPEYQSLSRRTLDQALATRLPQSMEVQDISGLWWLCRLVRLADENGAARVMAICTDVTQQRVATEGVKKEQQLLRRLIDIQEQERQLIAYEIHDGFAQQLAGALFRLQAFRETFSRNPAEAWKGFDAGVQLVCRAIDETRRLISGLRPPVLDEFGVVEAVQNLVYEHNRDGLAEIEFEHDMAEGRLPPPLENSIFRIVQESLTNAVRHSRSGKIGVALNRCGNRICIDVRDWGVGFDPNSVGEHRFGLQGIRERARLLEGRMTIESVPSPLWSSAVRL